MNIIKSVIKIVFFSAVVFSIVYLAATVTAQRSDLPQDSETSQITDTPSGYTVKEHNGKIAVFKGNETSPIRIIEEIYVRDLPSYDQTLLSEGIYLETDADLNNLLEDYDS